MDREPELHAMSRVFEYAQAALPRSGPPPLPFPIVLLLGPHGSGGTVTLRRLWDADVGRLRAAVDLGGAQNVADAVFAAVHGLRRKRAGRKRLWGKRFRERDFPRVGVVVAALGYAGNGNDAAAFRKHILDSAGSGQALARIMQSWGGRAAPLVAFAVQPDLPRFLADVIGSMISGLGAAHIDGLVAELGDYTALRLRTNLWREGLTGQAGLDARDAVDHLMVGAFVGDLRARFNRGPWYVQPPSNALLLIDNADGEAAVRFLQHTAAVRREAYRDKVAADPLLMIAVRHGLFHDPAAPRPLASTDEALVYVKPSANKPRPAFPDLWLPVELPRLTFMDVRDLTGGSHLGQSMQETFFHTLAAAHPGATVLLTKLADDLGPRVFGPPGILDEEIPAALPLPHIPRALRTGTVTDVLLRYLLGADPDAAPPPNQPAQVATAVPLIARLAVCAATTPVDPVAAGAVFSYLRWTNSVRETLGVLASGLWLPEDAADRADRCLDPLVARLLQRWLARHPALWTDVHHAYAGHYAQRNEARQLTHTLALVDTAKPDPLKTVVTQLQQKIGPDAKEDWYALLGEITRAPCRMPVTDDPSLRVNRIAGVHEGQGGLARAVGRLVVIRWLHDFYQDPYDRLAHTSDLEKEEVDAKFT